MAMAYGIPQAFQEAFGQAVINKNPGQAAYYDFQFEYQGPAQRVYCRAFLSSIDTLGEVAIDLAQATAWTPATARVNFTVPSTTPSGSYQPFVRICDRQDCLGSVVQWATTTAFNVAVQPTVPPFGVRNATVVGVG